MNHSKSLLIISTEFPPHPGGIGNHSFNLANEMVKRKIDVSVFTNFDKSLNYNLDSFDKAQKYNINRFRHFKFHFITYFIRIIDIYIYIKKKNFDVIVCSGKFSLWLGWLIKKRYPQQHINAIVHGSELKPSNLLFHYLTSLSLSYFDVIISVSNFTKSLLNDNLKNKTRVVPNGISFKGKHIFKSNKALNGSPIFLTVGSLTQRKGQKNFIRVIPELLKNYPSLHYHCVGMPIILQELKYFAQELGVLNKITFHGVIDNLSLYDFYNQADIFVMLSQNQDNGDVEGFGISILEANYFGTPAIGSNNCGIVDAINEKTGVIVSCDNINEIIMGIDDLILSIDSYSSESKKWAISHSWEIIGDSYQRILFNE